MPTRIIFYVVYRAADKAWFVTTTEHGKEVSVSGPYRLKRYAMDYATERAKNLGSPAQVKSQEKGKRRFNTEATYPRSSDPRKTKGVRRKS